MENRIIYFGEIGSLRGVRNRFFYKLLSFIIIFTITFSLFPIFIQKDLNGKNFDEIPFNESWFSIENQPLEALNKVELWIGKKDYKVNDQTFHGDVEPFILSGRTMVPLRLIAEGLGANVNWNPTEKKVIINYENYKGESTNLVLQIGNKNYWINNIEKVMDVEPKILQGRTMVPLRFISEGLGFEVRWDGVEKKVSVIGINPESDADKDTLKLKEEWTYKTNPNSKDTDNDKAEDNWEIQNGLNPRNTNTIYKELNDGKLKELTQKYPGLDFKKEHPDGITNMTLPEKINWELDPRTPYNLDKIVNDELVIKYGLLKGANPKREEVENIWNDFKQKYSDISEALRKNINPETLSIIDTVGDEVLKFKQLKLDEKLGAPINEKLIEKTIQKQEEYNGIAPLTAIFSEEFINQNKNYFNDLKKTNLEFINWVLENYPTLTITKQADLKREYPQLDFSQEKTFTNPDGKSQLSLEEKTKYQINPTNPHNFDEILNDKKAIEYGKTKGAQTKEEIQKTIKQIEENYGEKLGKALKMNLEEEIITPKELEQQGNTAKEQIKNMYEQRAYKKKTDGTTITLEDLTNIQRYKTLIFLNKTFGTEDVNILLSQSKTLSENAKAYSELVKTLTTATHKIEEPVNKEIKDLDVFKKYINQWGLYDNNAGELAVKIWDQLSPELKEEVKQHPKLFLSYIGKYRAWAEAGKVKIGEQEYDFREVFDDIVKYTKDQIEYVIKTEKYFQEKGYELYEYSGYGREIENLPFIFMQGSPFTPALSHIELIKNKLSAGKITLKEAIKDLMSTEGAEEILKIAEERYHNVPIGNRGCVSDFLGPGVGPKDYGSKPATSAMWVDVKVRGPPEKYAPGEGIPEANLPGGIIYNDSIHLDLTRLQTTQKLIELLQKTNPSESERLPSYATGDTMSFEKIIDDALLRFTIECKWGDYLSEQAIITRINNELMVPLIGMINRNILKNLDWNSFTASEDMDRYYITPYEFNPTKPLEVLTKKIHFKKGELRIPSIKDLY